MSFATGNRQWEAALPAVVDEVTRSKDCLYSWGRLMQGVNESTRLTSPAAAAHQELCRSTRLSRKAFNAWAKQPHPSPATGKGQRWWMANQSLRYFIIAIDHSWMCHLMLLIKTHPEMSAAARDKRGLGFEGMDHSEHSIERLAGAIPTSMETAIATQAFHRRRVLEADIALWSPIVEPLVPIFSGFSPLEQPGGRLPSPQTSLLAPGTDTNPPAWFFTTSAEAIWDGSVSCARAAFETLPLSDAQDSAALMTNLAHAQTGFSKLAANNIYPEITWSLVDAIGQMGDGLTNHDDHLLLIGHERAKHLLLRAVGGSDSATATGVPAPNSSKVTSG
ncbi:MAG TPA: hypothetical protein VHX15_11960 [Frankiaceae bacterium]|nr:hypothetical protein [Frankiaceae bacterium]